MPEIGEIRRGKEIGHSRCTSLFQWCACVVCGKERWVETRKGIRKSERCSTCGLAYFNANRRKEKELILSKQNKGTIDNPQIGDIRYGREINNKYGTQRYIWKACKNCGKERWVQLHRTRPYDYCADCGTKVAQAKRRGSNSPHWKGGSYRRSCDGYISINKYSVEPFYQSMAGKKREMLEHRYVMAKHLGRCLHPWEVVHHKNGIKDDNRIENLELTTANAHHKDHSKGYQDGYKKGYYDGKTKKIKELESRIKELEVENLLIKEDLPV